MTNHAQPGADAAEAAPVPYADATFELRQHTARTLLTYLQRSEAMIARCEIAMRDKGTDQFTAANAAVRIMKVGSDLTKSLMLVTYGETRHRSIRESVALPSRPRDPARTQIHEDMDASLALMSRELRALTEEIVDEAEKDRGDFGGQPFAHYSR